MIVARLSIVALAAAVSLAAPAGHAQEQLGSYKAWNAYTHVDGDNKICYIVSEPKESKPKNVRRGDIYFMVTHRPAESVADEVYLNIGYPIKPGAPVDVKVGSQRFALVTEGGDAWTPDAQTDGKLVKSMIRGRNLVVSGTSQRGTKTTDTFSLLGFTAAHKAITSACKK